MGAVREPRVQAERDVPKPEEEKGKKQPRLPRVTGGLWRPLRRPGSCVCFELGLLRYSPRTVELTL